jgi:cytochrome c-type biogenesis protein CcmH/NrfF
MSYIRIGATASGIALAIGIAALALPTSGQAVGDVSARVARLEDAVLAPCCYTEPVSRHQSEIAVKMRLEIAKWVGEGRSDREILDAYVQRYGAKVLVDPRTKPAWWMPWVPWSVLILAMPLGYWLLQQWHAKSVPALSVTGVEPSALPDFECEEED